MVVWGWPQVNFRRSKWRQGMMKTRNIIGYRRLWYVFSGLLLVLSVASVGLWGLKLGIDFTGGSLMEIRFVESRPELSRISEAIPSEYERVAITPLGDNGAALRLKSISADEHTTLLNALATAFPGETDTPNVIEDRFTSIGPTIGAELRSKSFWAIGAVLLAIVLYIAWAFRKVSRPIASWQYGIAAIVGLFHDVFIPVGVFAALGYFYGVEIDTLFITALLTMLGFSVHDTIVVFDRIRENLMHSTESFATVVNKSVNQTIARSINTSLTTLFVLLTTYFFGGESVRHFVLALILGIVFGTYSSIFIASPLLVTWHTWISKRKKI